MSDPGDAFGIGNDDAMFSPSSANKGESDCNLTPGTKSDRPTNDDLSMGDISPIKLIYNSDTSTNSQIPSSNSQGMASVVPVDWRNEQHCGVSHPPVRMDPLYVLKTVRDAFLGMKYILPFLKQPETGHPNDLEAGRRSKEKTDDTSVDAKIATRRIEAAICAFGGSANSAKRQQQWSIFRPKGASSEARQKYEAQLHRRYVMRASEVTWDVEENPPIDTETTASGKGAAGISTNRKTANLSKNPEKPTARDSGSTSDDSDSPENSGTGTTKMKYRCKLCGQPKQNHECPFTQPLQRSIGVMVFPAVNSYTAAEPGTVAAPLTQMNNFVSYDSDHTSPRPDYATGQGNHGSIVGYPSAISPDALNGDEFYHSPQSSLSAPSSEDPMSLPLEIAKARPGGGKRSHYQMASDSSHQTNYTRRSPFAETVSLRPEHYRAVTPMSQKSEATKGADGPTTASTAYQYPPIPLSFHERKRLSDTLFYLSRQVPCLMHDCASVLREARHRYEWDLAVAELLTQVVVGLYCGGGDARLDGLQQYLLAIGISC